MVGSLALAGIPPLNGFWSKLIIVTAGIQSGHTGWAITVVVISIVALAYQLKVQKEAFYGDPNAEHEPSIFVTASPQTFRESYFAMAPMILLAIGCAASSLLVVTGLDQPILIGPAADVLMQGVWTP